LINKELSEEQNRGKTVPPVALWRRIARIVHAILLPGIPFLKINGESALRFDIPQLKLYFFGKTFWMDEFFIVLVATLFLTFLIVSVTIIFGRIWCGWLCPQTVISDLTVFFERSLRKGFLYRASAYGGVFILSIFIGATLIWYFVSPYEFLHRLMAWELGKVIWGFWIVLTVIIFLDFTLVRRRFCATVCPYAKMQGMLFDNRTLIIAFDKRRQKECMDCRPVFRYAL
jgi:polyferredoxin